MFIYERLKKLREERGLSLDGLATELSKSNLNITRQTLWNWETGKTTPSANDLSAVMQFFDKPVAYFFNNQPYDTSKEKQ